MQNLKFKSVCAVFSVLVCFVALNAYAAERSMWQRFVNFFTPTGSIQGEGPVFDELKAVETQIDKIEVQYSRERRPGKKTRYRGQLDSLRNVRDSLIVVIEKMVADSSSKAASRVTVNAVPSSASVSSSSLVSSSATAALQLSSAVAGCVHDTVFVHDTLVVRDTVVIHDTLYVVLANKPGTDAPKEKKKADKASEK